MAAALARLRSYAGSHKETLWIILAACVLAFVTRPVFDVAPNPGIESGWQGALQINLRADRHFGGETGIYYTYGPLGWMRAPTYWTGLTGALAVLSVFAELVVFAGVLLAVVRQRLTWPWALVVTSCVLALQATVLYHPPLAMAALVAALYVIYDPRDRLQLWLAWAGGVGAGYAALGRINAGVMILAVVACALAFQSRRTRTLPIAIGSAAVTFVAGWLLTRNSLADLPSYVRGMADMVAGYSEGMVYEQPDAGWRYLAAAGLVVAGAAAALVGVRRDGTHARWALLCTWLIFSFLVFKQGFVRLDFHSQFFFQAMAAGLVVMPWPASLRAPAIATALVACTLFYGLALDRPVQNGLDFQARARSSAHALLLTVDGGRRARKIEAGHGDIRRLTGLPDPIAERLKRGSATVWPDDPSIVLALGSELRTLPTIATYTAMSPRLERHNVAALEKHSTAPDRILLMRGPLFEMRLPAITAPLTTLAVLCNYRLERPVTENFAILRQSSEPRCEQPQRRLKSTRAAWGEKIAVPAPSTPDGVVLARVHGAEVAGLEKVRTQFLRAYERNIVSDPAVDGAPALRYRVIPENAASGMLLRAGADVELPQRFEFTPQMTTMSLERKHAPGGKPLRIDFYEQRVR